VPNRTAQPDQIESGYLRAAQDMQPHAREAAALLKAIANRQRLMVLCHLLAGPLSVGELNEQIPLSQSALSQHLAILRRHNIVVAERQAQNVRYSLMPGIVPRVIRLLQERYCRS